MILVVSMTLLVIMKNPYIVGLICPQTIGVNRENMRESGPTQALLHN
jgi:hypothetical protein